MFSSSTYINKLIIVDLNTPVEICARRKAIVSQCNHTHPVTISLLPDLKCNMLLFFVCMSHLIVDSPSVFKNNSFEWRHVGAIWPPD